MVKNFKAGDQVVTFFILRKKELKAKTESGEFYLNLELLDASGRIFATLWRDAKQVYEKIETGAVVKVKAAVIDYHGKPHLTINRVRLVRDDDDYDLSKLVAQVDADPEQLLEKLSDMIKRVTNSHLSNLLQIIFNDEEISKQFAAAPGGKLWHHSYIGGLLEHTLNVTEIALNCAALYPEINHDLLLSAGLLHDIGKIKTYTYQTLIEFTDEGRLLGHIVMGSQMVKEKIDKIKDFPPQLEKELLHLILSHQGKLEHASPVVPMTLEGLLLYFADEIDSKANAFQRIKEKEGDQGWSRYVQLMNQYFYFGRDEKA